VEVVWSRWHPRLSRKVTTLNYRLSWRRRRERIWRLVVTRTKARVMRAWPKLELEIRSREHVSGLPNWVEWGSS